MIHSTWELKVGGQEINPFYTVSHVYSQPEIQETSKTKPNENNKRILDAPIALPVSNPPPTHTHSSSTPRGLVLVAINYSGFLGLRHLKNPSELQFLYVESESVGPCYSVDLGKSIGQGPWSPQ